MEEDNKYWLEEQLRKCVFCREGKDNFKHYVKKCEIVKEWFVELGEEDIDRYSTMYSETLDEVKERIIRKLWREKKNMIKKMKEVVITK